MGRQALDQRLGMMHMVHKQSLGGGGSDQPNSAIRFWDVEFANHSATDATSEVITAATRKLPVPIRLVNSYSIASASSLPQYKCVLRGPGFNYADGMPVAAALRILGRRTGGAWPARVRGPSLFENVLRNSEGMEVSHLFFGSSPKTLAKLAEGLSARYPDLSVSAYYSPPIADPEELVRIACEVHRKYGGDIVWLGLGTPKQDLVAAKLARALSRPCIGVGAAFDFSAGTAKSAPTWMQNSGLEWVFRFYCEPKRLMRRYTIGNLQFATIAIVEICRSLMVGRDDR